MNFSKREQSTVLTQLIALEQMLDDFKSICTGLSGKFCCQYDRDYSDIERYHKMMTRVDPTEPNFLFRNMNVKSIEKFAFCWCKQHLPFRSSYGDILRETQEKTGDPMVDFGYIEYYRKSLENSTDPEHKKKAFKAILTHEARRDYFTTTLRQINK